MSDVQLPESPLSALCRGCGLCCDGSLFTHVPLDHDEKARLKLLGVALRTQKSGTEVLAQRCSALEDRQCRIYADRPGGCASYQCVLAQALVKGEVTLEQAQHKVKKAQRLIREGHARRFLRREFRGRKGLYD